MNQESINAQKILNAAHLNARTMSASIVRSGMVAANQARQILTQGKALVYDYDAFLNLVIQFGLTQEAVEQTLSEGLE